MPLFLVQKFKCNPCQFLAWRTANSGYEMAWCGVYADVKPFMKWTPGPLLKNTGLACYSQVRGATLELLEMWAEIIA